MGNLFDPSFKILEKALDFCSLRHDILAANVANAETPNYRPFDLIFKEELKKVTDSKDRLRLICTNNMHLAPSTDVDQIKPRLILVRPTVPSPDGNWVDIDYQMAQLAENSLMYQVMTRILSQKFNKLRYAINEGR